MAAFGKRVFAIKLIKAAGARARQAEKIGELRVVSLQLTINFVACGVAYVLNVLCVSRTHAQLLLAYSALVATGLPQPVSSIDIFTRSITCPPCDMADTPESLVLR